jgi:NAD(P)-dependent dehydrogenase (short-subunit alcohol dehydrogenase family)
MYEAQSLDEIRSIKAMLSLAGKKALVTGAAGGIGRACAAALAEMGADLVLMDVPAAESRLNEIAQWIRQHHGVKVIIFTGDVASEESVKRLYLEIEDQFGTIHVAFSNAGIVSKQDFVGLPVDEWKRMLDINLTGMLLIGRHAAEMMKRHAHGGSVINTASMSGFIVNRRIERNKASLGYTSTKAAVIHLTKSLAINYIADNIRFNSISPGYILSGLHVNNTAEVMDYFASTAPLGRFGLLQEITGAVVFLASDLSSYCIGTNLVVDGGYSIW